MQTSIKIKALPFSSYKTYLAAAVFAIGNIIMPQLFHLVPQGGATWLPIYFFTLVGACKYGWRVGLLTAIASPLVNSAFFGMPSVEALPAIILKSVLLAVFAGYAVARFKKVSLGVMMAVVLSYQVVGTVGEWMMTGDFALASQDFRIGIPGMILQILGGWLVVRFLLRSQN